MSGRSLDGFSTDGIDPAATIRPLLGLLDGCGSIAVVCHDDPDPDCLASAYALQRLAERRGADEAHIVYGGEVSHEQNWEMIETLGIEARPLDDRTLATSDLVAFVDHSVPGRNNSVPPGTDVDVVVDHHPTEVATGRYVDNRPQFGATATMLTDYFRRLGIAPRESLATALLFGIRRETLEFTRTSTTFAEYRAAEVLHPHADLGRIRELSEALFTPRTLDAIASVIDHRECPGSVLISGAGVLPDREAIPLAADYLTNLADTSTTVVFGVVDGTVQVSARTQNEDVHVGRRLERAFDDLGSAGGHRNMAGAAVPVEPLGGDPDDVDLVDGIVRRRVYGCFWDLF